MNVVQISELEDEVHRLRAALRACETRGKRMAEELSVIFLALPIGVCILDTDLRYVRLNERLARMNGLPVEAHLGKTPREIVPDVAPEAEPLLRQVLEAGTPITGSTVRGRTRAAPDVEREWVSHYWPLKDDGGRVFGVTVVVEESTERKRLVESLQREEEFRTLAENSTDVIVRYDRSLRRSYANPAIELLFGLPRETTIGKTNLEIGVPADVASVWDEHLRRAFATGQERTMEFWLPTPKGRRYLQSRVVPELNARGEVETLLGITRDLTRNKYIEEALRDSEKQYRELVENLHEGIWRIDQEEKTTFVNRRMAEMLGYEPAEMMAKPLSSFMSDKAVQTATRNIARGRRHVRAAYEFEFQHKDGTPILTRIATTPLFDEAGRYRGALASVVDITERKRVEEALRESEARFRQVIELVPDVLYRSEVPSHRATFVSSAIERMLGFTPMEWLADPTMWLRQMHDDDREQALAEIEPSVALGDGFVVRYRIWRKDRHSFRWVEDRARIERDRDGRATAIFGALSDITDRVRAEETIRRREQEFRALAESSLDVVSRFDRELRYRYMNPAIESITGQPPEAFVNKTIFEGTLPAKTKAVWVDELNKVLATGKDSRFTFRYPGRDGNVRVFDTRLVPEFGTNDEVASVISVTREVTRIYEAEEQVRKNVKQLEVVNELLEAQTRTDSLTGLANRRYLFDYMEREWRRETRHGHVISLIIADIDFFKAYNDHYGHLAGDECLRRVAHALRAQVHRPGDLLARYGGEEFVAVLPETPLGSARELAEAMRHAVADLRMKHERSPVAPHVTISLGVAELAPKGHKTDDLFLLADNALYRAKEKGRNAVECAV